MERIEEIQEGTLSYLVLHGTFCVFSLDSYDILCTEWVEKR